MGRYLDNSTFRNMVASGWIGSTPEQSALLELAIRAVLESGKAVVIATKVQTPRKTQEEAKDEGEGELV